MKHKNGEDLIPFVDSTAFGKWLKTNHAKSKGFWLKLAKKDSGTKSITYAEALDEALCWGWIDGQKGSFDDAWWLQRFCPRGPRTIWSKINREKVAKLIDDGRMKPQGQSQIDLAKQKGAWDLAYDSPSKATVPEDLEAAFAKNAKAKAFFTKLDATNRYAILHRLMTAKKPETRLKRLETFVAMLSRGEAIYPDRLPRR